MDNLIAYWEAWLNDEIKIPMTTDGYIINYTIINMRSNEGVGDWLCCNSKKKAFSFIKDVLIPSVQVTRSIGREEKEVFLDVSTYEETIAMLEEWQYNSCDIIEEYKKWYNYVEDMEERDASFEEINEFLQKISASIVLDEEVLINLAIYKNIKSVGRVLVKEYSDQGMLNELEKIMGLSADEILELFDNIDKNKFMLNKISVLLNGKILI